MNKYGLPMKRILLTAAVLGLASSGWAKLPELTPEAKAKAAENAAKAAWTGKVDAYKLCQAQDRVAAHYRRTAAAAGKTPGASVSTAACADPGPFVYQPPEAKPLEAAGAHSPATTAAAPPVTTNQPQAEVKTGNAPATAASGSPAAAGSASGVAPAAKP